MTRSWIFLMFFLCGSSGALAQLPVNQQRSDIRVLLTPVQHTVLSTEIPGRISALKLRAGDSFRKGEELVRLDCSLHQARRDKALAQADEAAKIKAVNTQLDRYGSVSTLELDVAAARLAAAEAEISLMQSIVDKCRVLAPFNGKISARHAQPHQYVGEGQELLSIIDDTQLEVELVIPSRWLSRIAVDQSFRVSIEETGKAYEASITRIGASIDAVSQTIKVYALIVAPTAELRAGMSGTANLEMP